jgi:hypothetical protein
MIRLALSVKSSRSTSCSSAYDLLSSSESEVLTPVVVVKPPAPLPSLPAPVAPGADASLPIWEDYMPDLQKNIEDLTRALGAYI